MRRGEVPCDADMVSVTYESGDSERWLPSDPTRGLLVASDGTESEVYGGFSTTVE